MDATITIMDGETAHGRYPFYPVVLQEIGEDAQMKLVHPAGLTLPLQIAR